MLVGKYLQYALVGSALATFAAGEESRLRRGARKLGNRKNRGYGGGSGRGLTSAPIDNSEPFPTLSPTLEVRTLAFISHFTLTLLINL